MKTIAELLASAPLSVISCFALHGQSDSAYYLEGSRDSSDETWIKKLYGPKLVSLDIEGLRLKYPPQVFSQINESILPQMISVVRKMLAHGPETRLIDLYCGYGLFSHALAGSVREIVGIDYDRSAIKTASENAVHIGHGKKSVFMTAGITGEFLSSHLPTAGRRAEAVILDPPRNGSGAGVIAAIAERHPLSAVHICCGIDIIGNEIDLWKEHGYRPGEVVPFDMFPGTVNVETVMHLVPV
jgi:tRNA/tmRNA/rRNA uracil-C5-methylase (TrmA/RlmC/RlmD family)